MLIKPNFFCAALFHHRFVPFIHLLFRGTFTLGFFFELKKEKERKLFSWIFLLMGLNLHHLPVVVKAQMKQNCKFWIAKSWRQIIKDWGGIELVTPLDFVQRFESSRYIKNFHNWPPEGKILGIFSFRMIIWKCVFIIPCSSNILRGWSWEGKYSPP